MSSKVSYNWDKSYKQNINNQLKPNKFLIDNIKPFLKCIKKDLKILDIGCGIGDKTFLIYNLGFHNILGIDSSKEAINYANKNFQPIKFYKQNILKTKFKNNAFDAIISVAVFHCFKKKNRIKYIKEISRLLKSKGFLFQLVLSSEDSTKKKYKEIEKNTFMNPKNNLPFHLFTETELKNYFQDFRFINLKHHKKAIKGKDTIAVYTMILKNKIKLIKNKINKKEIKN